MTPIAHAARARLAQAQTELVRAEQGVRDIETSCSHHWNDPVYDPVVRQGYSQQDLMGPFRIRGDGSIDAPTVWVPEERTPRWKRECSTCGKVEHTSATTQHVTKTPRFQEP